MKSDEKRDIFHNRDISSKIILKNKGDILLEHNGYGDEKIISIEDREVLTDDFHIGHMDYHALLASGKSFNVEVENGPVREKQLIKSKKYRDSAVLPLYWEIVIRPC